MTTTSRWQRKWERDHLTDGWSPIPTQIVSRRTARRRRHDSALPFVIL